MGRNGESGELANVVIANVRGRAEDDKRREQSGVARRNRAARREKRYGGDTTFPVPGALTHAPREFPAPDEYGVERLRRLDECLAVISDAFPGVESSVSLCRLSCVLLEGAWRERAEAVDPPGGDDSCTCALCAHLPKPLSRTLEDYDWRRSDGRALSVKTWPYRRRAGQRADRRLGRGPGR